MVSETLHPIKKAAALTRALAVASNKMNTTIVLGDTLARRPSSAMVITRLMRCPGVRPGALLLRSGHQRVQRKRPPWHRPRGIGAGAGTPTVGPSARTGRTTRQLGPGRLSCGQTAEARASQSVPVHGLLRTLPADRPHRRVRLPSVLDALPRASFPFVAPTAVCTSRLAESSPASRGRACQPHDHVPRMMMYSVIAPERHCPRQAGRATR